MFRPTENKGEFKSNATAKERVVVLGLKNVGIGESVEEQIDNIVKTILAKCEVWEKSETNSKWIVGWPEDGIGVEGDALTVAELNYLHQQMLGLVKQYPQLTIKAGSVLVDRLLSESESKATTLKEKAEKLLGYFPLHPHVEDFSAVHEDDEYKTEQDKIRAILNDEEKLKKAHVRSNTCYVYTFDKQTNKETFIKHRKSNPFQETHTNNFFWRPASSKSYNPIIDLYNPRTKNTVKVGLEICYEHVLGTVRVHCEKHPADLPLIQFIVSDSTPLYPRNLVGMNIVQFDALRPAKLFKNAEAGELVDVVYYQCDLDEPDKMARVDVDTCVLTIRDFIKQRIEEYAEVLNYLKGLTVSSEVKPEHDVSAGSSLLDLVKHNLSKVKITDELIKEYLANFKNELREILKYKKLFEKSGHVPENSFAIINILDVIDTLADFVLIKPKFSVDDKDLMGKYLERRFTSLVELVKSEYEIAKFAEEDKKYEEEKSSSPRSSSP